MLEGGDYSGRDVVHAAVADAKTLRLVDRLVVLWNDGPLEMAEEVYAPDLKLNGAPVGVHGLVALLAGVRRSFSHMAVGVDDAVATHDRVVLRMTWTGTHTADYTLRSGLVLPPSGRSFATPMIEIYEIVETRVAAAWLAWDALAHALQLGAEVSSGSQ